MYIYNIATELYKNTRITTLKKLSADSYIVLRNSCAILPEKNLVNREVEDVLV